MYRRDESKSVRSVKKMYVEGKTRRGRPKKRWLDVIDSDMKSTGVSKRIREIVKLKLRNRMADPK